jgi:predicted lipoprotein with Yx(FWY)xxD motif
MKAVNLGIACLSTLCALCALPAHAAGPAPVKKVDGILVDAHGMTVYTFDKDVAGSGKSACSGSCAQNWPAVKAGDATLPSPYSTIVRDDGTKQLAYHGKPLYTFVKDKKAGEREGDKKMNVWHVVTD